jgi:hypothetical protein
VAHADLSKQNIAKLVVIPASLDDTTRELEGLGRLLQARNWERAAIVFAWTEPGVPHLASAERAADTRRLSITAFAALDITGLRSRESVARYRRAWEMAVDDGQAIAVGPGDEAALPAREWPPFRDESPSRQLAAQYPHADALDTFRAVVEQGALQDVLRDHPETLARLAEQMAGMSKRPVRVEPQPAPPEQEPAVPRLMVVSEWDDKATRAVAALNACLRAEDAGTWTPSEDVGALLHVLGRMLTQRDRKHVVSEELFDQMAEQLESR